MEAENTSPARLHFEVKDIAVMMPVLGSALAIAYEIGSFVPLGTGAFALFSVSEHLLWALLAFPIALLVLAGVTICFMVAKVQRTRQAVRRRRPDAGRRKKRLLRIGGTFSILWGFVGIYIGLSEAAASLIVVACGVFLFGLNALFLIIPDVRSALAPLVFFSLLVAAAFGLDTTKTALQHTCAAEFNFKVGTRYAVLVRSGERGLLLFDRDTQRFSFARWDELKEIDWGYTTLRSRFAALHVEGTSTWQDLLRPWRMRLRVDEEASRANCKKFRS